MTEKHSMMAADWISRAAHYCAITVEAGGPCGIEMQQRIADEVRETMRNLPEGMERDLLDRIHTVLLDWREDIEERAAEIQAIYFAARGSA